MTLNEIIGPIIAILLMAATILIGVQLVLKIKPIPVGKAIIIATVSVLLGKWFVATLHLPALVSYALPTAAFLILSYVFFKPSPIKFILYWLVGFAAYLLIHIIASSLFDWPYMFPFWPGGI